jgi:hypothetical protein
VSWTLLLVAGGVIAAFCAALYLRSGGGDCCGR